MKCPYRKIKLHRTYEEGSYVADEETFADCYENECPFYFAIERKEVVVPVELCRIAEMMVKNADKGEAKNGNTKN